MTDNGRIQRDWLTGDGNPSPPYPPLKEYPPL
jgi:hypothetical protein